MSGVRTIGQRRCVDVVVVHHRAKQHQLEQTGNTNTQKDETEMRSQKKTKITGIKSVIKLTLGRFKSKKGLKPSEG